MTADIGLALRKIIAELEAIASSDDPPEAGAVAQAVDISSASNTARAIQRAEEMLAFRRFRKQTFTDLAPMMHEPVWDMVLHLFLANLQGRELSVSELETLCDIPHSTAFRYKSALIDAGWIEQRPARRDARKEMLSLHRARVSQLLEFLTAAPFSEP